MEFSQLKSLPFKEYVSSRKRALISLSIALFSLSFAAIFIKLSEQEIGPGATVFNRLWIAAIVLGGWNWIEHSRAVANDEPDVELFPKKLEILLVILVGVVGTASGMCWAWSLTQTSVANSSLMRNLSPLFTCLQGWLFFKQRFDTRFIVGMMLAAVGASLIGIGDIQIGIEHLTGDALGLLAALFYAFNLLILEYLRSKFSAVTLLCWRCAIGAIALIPIVGLTEDTFFPHSLQGWLIIVALAVVCQCFGQCVLVHNLNQFRGRQAP